MLAAYGCVKFYSQVVFRLIPINVLKFFGMVDFSFDGLTYTDKFDGATIQFKNL